MGKEGGVSNRGSVSIADIYFKSKELEKRGYDVIHLDVGEPDFGPPEAVISATREAIRDVKSRYTMASGIAELREAIADRLNRRYKTNILPEQVLFTSGGRLSLYLAFASLRRNSSVGIITPDWPAYRDLCRLMEYREVFIPSRLEDAWTPDLSAIGSEKLDAIVLNYPNNPTGKILDPETFGRVVEIAKEKDAMIISDEVYSDYLLSAGKFRSVLQAGEGVRFIFATSLSKSYSMTGYRAGYLVSDPETISRLEQINGLILTSAPEFVQYAALAALRCDDYLADKVSLIKRRAGVASKALREAGCFDYYEPDGALYYFPRVRSWNGRPVDSERLALDLLERAHVSITPGTVFGGHSFMEYIRITLLQDEDRLRKGIRLIGESLSSSP